MLVPGGLIRSACVALVMLNLVARWCDASCCGPEAACADGCGPYDGDCCVVAAPDRAVADADRDVPAGDPDADHSKAACSAVCCAKVVVFQLAPFINADAAPQGWLTAAADIAPDLLTASGIFHPPRA